MYCSVVPLQKKAPPFTKSVCHGPVLIALSLPLFPLPPPCRASHLQSKMAPLQACLKEAGDCRTRDDFENHTKAIGEAMGERL